MADPNSDFEQNFLAQVKGETSLTADPQPTPPPEKTPINKKIIIIIALAALFIITLVTLLLIKPKPAAKADIDIIGYWGCNDGSEVYFNADNTYAWYQDPDALVVDAGEFRQDGATLTITSQSQNGSQSIIDLYLDADTLILSNQSNNATYSCTEVRNE